MSLKPNVAYLVLNFWALWKKQTMSQVLPQSWQSSVGGPGPRRLTSQPPSADPPSAPPRRGKDPSGRKPGGQAGHEGKGRELLPASAVDR